ncbi:hypothetical protein CCACVL1_03511 [Corchorus capsularis]|uniref:Uncharacterized protein n=1 Tax=Corchorus capsularis TaxID=210143 RepID=A0A1R3JYR0_COCAP|nr:hypothetical protein CCACVL1_03511 [Corchorus capsularis]
MARQVDSYEYSWHGGYNSTVNLDVPPLLVR